MNVPRLKYRPGETVKGYVTYRPFREPEKLLPIDFAGELHHKTDELGVAYRKRRHELIDDERYLVYRKDDIVLLPDWERLEQLAEQILNGAPADVFASANMSQMNNAIDAGWRRAKSAIVFASFTCMRSCSAWNRATCSTFCMT